MIHSLWKCFFLLIVCLVKQELGAGHDDSHGGGQEPVQDNRVLLRRGTMYPVLTSANLSYSVVTGSKCVLECQVDNLGQFVVLWRKGDRVLSVGNLLVRKDGKVKVTPRFGLELSNVETSDEGQYSCQLDVFGETQTALHNLTVLVPPKIHSWERTLEVTAGDDLNMVCEASGNPKPWVQWKRYETGRTMDGDTVMLRNISRLDAGMYVCTADNSVTQPVERVTKVVVRHPPEVRLEETWRQNGDKFEVQLQCHITSYPDAKISWHKNGNVRLSESDEIVIKDNSPKHTLKIEKLKSKNFGDYSCKASNELGSSEDSLEITGKPRPPIFSSEMREIIKGVENVNISWSCDSMAPITQYYFKFRKYKLQTESLTKDWQEKIVMCDVTAAVSAPVLTHSCWHLLTSLEPDTMYDILVSALNHYGQSQLSKLYTFYFGGDNSDKERSKKNGTRQGLAAQSDISPRQLLRESKDVASASQSPSHQCFAFIVWMAVLSINLYRH